MYTHHIEINIKHYISFPIGPPKERIKNLSTYGCVIFYHLQEAINTYDTAMENLGGPIGNEI
jgi:hypothetical protein